MLAKQLTYLAGADSAGIVLGARVPIVLTSRADNVRSRLASTAVLKLVAHDRRAKPATTGPALQRGLPMADAILVLNAGSSSLKFSLYTLTAGPPVLVQHGQFDGLTTATRFVANAPDGTPLADQSVQARAGPMTRRLTLSARASCAARSPGERCAPSATGSSTAACASCGRCASMRPSWPSSKSLVPLAPLHQPHNLAPIRALLAQAPDLPQVACFDTSFHRTMPQVAQAFALPPAITDRGVRRYGFHGLSYEYIASVLPGLDPAAAKGRTVVAHLGNGASMCALRGMPQRGHDDGVHRGRRPDDGHAHRRARSRRHALSHERIADGRPRDRAPDLPGIGIAGCVRRVERHAHAAGQRRPARGIRDRAFLLPDRARAGLAGRGAGQASMRWCSPAASASTRRRCASAW